MRPTPFLTQASISEPTSAALRSLAPRQTRVPRRTLLPLTSILPPLRSDRVLPSLVAFLLVSCGVTPPEPADSRAPATGVAQSALFGSTLWLRDYGGTTPQDSAYANGVAVDPSGNILVAGYLHGTVYFNGACDVLSSGPQNNNAYVAKFAPDGTCLWAHAYGDLASYHSAEGIAVDANGNVFVVGSFSGAMEFDCLSTHQAGTAIHVFLAKLSGDGICRWAKDFGDFANSALGYSVAVDNNGLDSTVAITGATNGSIDFTDSGTMPLSRPGDFPGFSTYVAKFLDRDGDYDGNYQEANLYGTSGDAFGRGIAVDNLHRVVVTGYFTGAINFGSLPGTNLVSVGQEDIFIAQLNADLSHRWSKQYGDSQPQLAYAVATDSSRNVILTGGFWGTIVLPQIGVTLAGRAGESIFLITLYEYGGEHSAKQFGELGDTYGTSLATGPGNSIFLTGWFSGQVTFPRAAGTVTLISSSPAGSRDVYLAKFASDLRNFDAMKFGSQTDGYDSYGESVGLDSVGNLVVGGAIAGTMSIGGYSITSQGNADVFLMKMAHQCDGANCSGCCDGSNSCQVPSVQSCGADGNTCLACGSTADSCVAGQCRCGSGPACAIGQRCDSATHTCVCDATSCPNGCCNGGSSGTCQARDFNHCAPVGQACVRCNNRSDTCHVDGTCGCGSASPCALHANCLSGQCECNDCGTYPNCFTCGVGCDPGTCGSQCLHCVEPTSQCCGEYCAASCPSPQP